MFRVVIHPSPGAHNTVFTVSGINKTCIATCRERGWIRTHPGSNAGRINLLAPDFFFNFSTPVNKM